MGHWLPLGRIFLRPADLAIWLPSIWCPGPLPPLADSLVPESPPSREGISCGLSFTQQQTSFPKNVHKIQKSGRGGCQVHRPKQCIRLMLKFTNGKEHYPQNAVATPKMLWPSNSTQKVKRNARLKPWLAPPLSLRGAERPLNINNNKSLVRFVHTPKKTETYRITYKSPQKPQTYSAVREVKSSQKKRKDPCTGPICPFPEGRRIWPFYPKGLRIGPFLPLDQTDWPFLP